MKKARKLLWRKCGTGKHWRSQTLVRSHRRNGKVVKQHYRRGGCAKNPSGKDEIYSSELLKISRNHFDSLKGPPKADDLGYKNGNEFDEIIRGWTKYWNETLEPTTKLDPNLVKALIASESSFIKSSRTKAKSRDNIAHGLMQVTGETLKILRDEKGELRDQLVNLSTNELLNPSLNVAAGIRWLFRKREIVVRRNKDASWIDAVREYKSYKSLNDPQMQKFKNLYDRLQKK